MRLKLLTKIGVCLGWLLCFLLSIKLLAPGLDNYRKETGNRDEDTSLLPKRINESHATREIIV